MVEFAYAVGRIRALEAHLLDESKVMRMVEARDFESAYTLLREIPHYAEKIDRLEHPFDFASLLENERLSVRELLSKLAPDNAILEILWKKFDQELPLESYLKLLSRAAEKHHLPLFTKYVKGFVLLNQLRLNLLRGKVETDAALAAFRYTDFNPAVSRGLEHYKKSGSLFALEREIDLYLMETIQRAKYMAFGIEPLIGFFIAKEIEIKIVRLILTCKQMHVRTEAIKERLRLPYV